MKKFFKSVMLFAAAAMAFTACSDNDELESVVTPGEEAGELKLVATAEFENETRAEFENGNGGQMIFSDGDKIMLKYVIDGSNWVNESADLRYNAQNCLFEGTQPIKPIKEGSNINIELKETIPAVQTNIYNNGYFNLKLLAFKFNPLPFESWMQKGDVVSIPLKFQHVASYMQIRFVTEDSAIAGKTIKSVRFEANGASQTVNGYDVTPGNSVEVNFDGLAKQPTAVNKADAKDYNNVAYLAVVPQAYTNAKFVVTTMTDEVYTIDVPAKTFERGHVHRIALNLKAAPAPTPDPEPTPGDNFVYTRLTSANTNLLVNGAEFIMMGSRTTDRYASKQDGGYKIPYKTLATPVVDFNAVKPEEVADARVFKLKDAGDGKWYITSPDEVKYLKLVGTTYMEWVELSSGDAAFMFTIEALDNKTKIRNAVKNKFVSMYKNDFVNQSRLENIDLFIYMKVPAK